VQQIEPASFLHILRMPDAVAAIRKLVRVFFIAAVAGKEQIHDEYQ
jgi:hypothetical protein